MREVEWAGIVPEERRIAREGVVSEPVVWEEEVEGAESLFSYMWEEGALYSLWPCLRGLVLRSGLGRRIEKGGRWVLVGAEGAARWRRWVRPRCRKLRT